MDGSSGKTTAAAGGPSAGGREQAPGDEVCMQPCRVCEGAGPHAVHIVREMMFGTRRPYRYFQCRACGCLQIEAVPPDLASAYPASYYSLARDPADDYQRPLRNAWWRWCDRALLFAPAAAWLPWPGPPSHVRDGLAFLRRVPGLRFGSRIADVGCGTAELLHRLQHIGFTRLTGADPFLPADRQVSPRLRLLARGIEELDGEFDIVVLNHAFEHIPGQLSAMQALRRLLAPRGMAVIRVPLVDSQAWQDYGVNWFQLDAPRHLYLHTQRSLKQLAARAGLALQRVVHDSDHHQFYVSERYQHDVPLVADPLRPDGLPAPFRLGSRRRRAWARRARELNRLGRGDQASFYLSPA